VSRRGGRGWDWPAVGIVVGVSARREQGRRGRRAEAVLAAAEDVVYVGIAALLVVAAGVLLVVAADELLDILDGLASEPIVEVLDTLLLVFIVVELLSAVRSTVAKRELVAEPFLLVGIIASIKEIVVLSVKAADDIGKGSTFSDQLWQIGVLGVVVLLLGATAWLLRVKEREPAEGEMAASAPPRQ
jgi:uncharacterized membrane protein (DUF373 family)